MRRTLDAAELGDWVDRLCQVDGPQRLAPIPGTGGTGRRCRGRSPDRSESPVPDDRRGTGHPAGDHIIQGAGRASGIVALRPGPDAPIYGSWPTACASPRRRTGQCRILATRAIRTCRSSRRTSPTSSRELSSSSMRPLPSSTKASRYPDAADDSHDLLGTYRVVADLAEMTTARLDSRGIPATAAIQARDDHGRAVGQAAWAFQRSRQPRRGLTVRSAWAGGRHATGRMGRAGRGWTPPSSARST